MRNRLSLAVLAFVLAVQSSTAVAQGGPPPANVTIDEVRTETLIRRRAVTGEIRSRLTSNLATQVEGLLVELNVDEGDIVKKGQVIAKLDDERARIAVERAQSEVAYAQSLIAQRQVELDNTLRDLERLEELDRMGSSGVSQLDEARTLVSSRKAQLAQAQAELTTSQGDLALAKRELKDMSIEAPFDGRVVRKSSEIGQWVGRGDEIVTVISLNLLEARIDIPEEIYPALNETMTLNDPIEMRLPALGLGTGQEVFGQVIAILPAADSLSRLFPVRIAVDNTDAKLRPGMSLNAMVPTGIRGEFTTVSKDAIVRTASGEVVYFVSDGVSAIAPVERLFAIGDRMAIRSPMLRAGMSVVTTGNERMYPGQPLNILSEPKGPELNGDANGRGAPGSAPAEDN